METSGKIEVITFFTKLYKSLSSISITTYLLFCVFGIGSWVAINGIWAELPILLVTQPECYKLATTLSVVVQVANIGPLLYSVVKMIWHKTRLNDFYLEVAAVIVIVIIGIVSCVLLSLFWNTTAVINDESHSVVLIILSFLLALVDCTSSVVFVPFMKHFPAKYLSALFIGEGLSGVLPSALALIQGSVNNSLSCDPGKETYESSKHLGIRYSPNLYFVFLAGIMVACGLAFIGILVIPAARKERKKWEENQIKTHQNRHGSVISSASSIPEEDMNINETPIEEEEVLLTQEPKEDEVENEDEQEVKLVKHFKTERYSTLSLSYTKKVLLIIWNQRTPLFCIAILSFITNGAISSISPYAFGNYSNLVLHLAINLALLANPIAVLIFTIFPVKSRMLTAVFTSISCIMGVYVLITALTGGSLVTGITGGMLIVSVYVCILLVYQTFFSFSVGNC